MSVNDAVSRIAQIRTLLDPANVVGAAAAPASSSDGAQSTSFSSLLTGAGVSTGLPGLLTQSGGYSASAGQRMVQIAEGEVGQGEIPPGSNDSPRIALYRSATAGSRVGPWCAYFASWAAQQAGVPLGEAGQGFGSVDAIAAWGQRTGRYYAPGTQAPQPGDLILWGGRHVGIVESVGADGSITTIEGNSTDAVSRQTYGPDGGGATGFVRPGVTTVA